MLPGTGCIKILAKVYGEAGSDWAGEHDGSQQIHAAEGDGLMMAPLAGIRFQKGVESRSICLQPYLEMIAIRKWQC